MKYVSDRRFNLGGGAEILTLGSGLADNTWHKVSKRGQKKPQCSLYGLEGEERVKQTPKKR